MRCEATVAPDNLASLRLWSRLGFSERTRTGTDLILEWRAPGQAATDVGRRPPPAR
jgi:RimJ/RimL family protein N-acetyltransferase